MATKNQIIEALKQNNIEHDPKANKGELLALLPEEQQDFFSNGSAANGGVIVRLIRNFKGRQVGETFTTKTAERLGILDHCQPFEAAE